MPGDQCGIPGVFASSGAGPGSSLVLSEALGKAHVHDDGKVAQMMQAMQASVVKQCVVILSRVKSCRKGQTKGISPEYLRMNWFDAAHERAEQAQLKILVVAAARRSLVSQTRRRSCTRTCGRKRRRRWERCANARHKTAQQP